MTIHKTARRFKYSGLMLPDPGPDLDVESVRSLYAASYPEITTAALTGPEAVDGDLVYTFSKSARRAKYGIYHTMPRCTV
jgi:PRTRC genetic system protein C